MSKPIAKKQSGQVQMSVWQGEYNGKPTYSFTFQKSYKDKNGQWQNTNFFNQTDLADVFFLAMATKLNKINKQEKKQEQTGQPIVDTATEVNPQTMDDNIPW